jgi:hypothetical protein
MISPQSLCLPQRLCAETSSSRGRSVSSLLPSEQPQLCPVVAPESSSVERVRFSCYSLPKLPLSLYSVSLACPCFPARFEIDNDLYLGRQEPRNCAVRVLEGYVALFREEGLESVAHLAHQILPAFRSELLCYLQMATALS